jgi:mRNA-degrading endonuclease YafQ of YafQ-DinJ toxin-antitoxin module
MPTREVLASFWRDWDQLSPKQQREFRAAVTQFIANLADDKQGFHPRLRVKRVQGHPGIWEMTWAYDGRATFQYGKEVQSGQPHIIWRRIGTHAIFRRP